MTTYKDFHLISLDAEGRAKTCGYWYLIQTYGGTAHTAFRSKAALLLWLGERGLCPSQAIPDPGTHSYQAVASTYRTLYVDRDGYENALIRGIPSRAMHNARYRPVVITHDPDGVRTVHVAHYDGAPEYDRAVNEAHYCGEWVHQ